MRYALAIVFLVFGGFYYYTSTQAKPMPVLAPLPPPAPPPPPPPPPTLGPKELSRAERRLFDTRPQIRMRTVRELAGYFNPEIDELLDRQLKIDSDAGVKTALVQLLAQRKVPGAPEGAAAQRVLPALHDTEPAVRRAAISALRESRAFSASENLSMLLFDTDVDIRREAIAALNFLAGAKTQKIMVDNRPVYQLPTQFESIYQKALAHARTAEPAAAPRTP